MSDVSNPGRYAIAVTPHATNVFANPSRALYIGGAGDLAVRMWPSGNLVTFVAVPIGILPIQVDKVLATGTAATNIISLY